LTGKSKEREDALHAGEGSLQGQLSKYGRTHKGRSKGKALTSVKTWDDSSSKDEPPRTCSHRSSSWSSRKCLMARGKMSIPSSCDDSSSDDEGEGKPSVDELAEVIIFFFRMYALSKRINLKL
jgi:hypothetical protein